MIDNITLKWVRGLAKSIFGLGVLHCAVCAFSRLTHPNNIRISKTGFPQRAYFTVDFHCNMVSWRKILLVPKVASYSNRVAACAPCRVYQETSGVHWEKCAQCYVNRLHRAHLNVHKNAYLRYHLAVRVYIYMIVIVGSNISTLWFGITLVMHVA